MKNELEEIEEPEIEKLDRAIDVLTGDCHSHRVFDSIDALKKWADEYRGHCNDIRFKIDQWLEYESRFFGDGNSTSIKRRGK